MNVVNRRRLTLREARGEMSIDDYRELIEDSFEFVEHSKQNLEYLKKSLGKIIDMDEEDALGGLLANLEDIHIHGVEGFSVGNAIKIMSKTEKSLEGIARDLEMVVKDVSVRRKELIKVEKEYGDFIDEPME